MCLQLAVNKQGQHCASLVKQTIIKTNINHISAGRLCIDMANITINL